MASEEMDKLIEDSNNKMEYLKKSRLCKSIIGAHQINLSAIIMMYNSSDGLNPRFNDGDPYLDKLKAIGFCVNNNFGNAFDVKVKECDAVIETRDVYNIRECLRELSGEIKASLKAEYNIADSEL